MPNLKGYMIFQVGVQAIYCSLLLIQLVAHDMNYKDLLLHNEDVMKLKDYDSFYNLEPFVETNLEKVTERQDLIKQGVLLELCVIAFFVIDLVLKVMNHLAILDLKKSDKNKVKGKDKGKELIDVLFDSGFIYLKGEPIISTSVIAQDLTLIILLFLAFVIEQASYSSGSLDFLKVGSLIVARLFLRLPFMIELVTHHYKLRLCRVQQNLIFPNRDKRNFSNYKEKVLYILEQVRKQFGKVIYMSHANNDLAWCSFVIENDYL